LNSALQSQFALLRTELLLLVADRIEQVARPLHREMENFKLLFARVTDSGERAVLTVSCQSSVVVDDETIAMMASKASDEAVVDKAPRELDVVAEESFFSCFSPHVYP
jgi:hypothetical protein